MKVSREWKDLNVDLGKLASRIESFFRGKGLYAKRISSKEGIKLLVTRNVKLMSFRAEILGDPNDFQVNLVLDEQPDSRTLSSVFSAFFGGGFLLKDIKTRELFEKLEPDFWVYVERTVEHLSAFKGR